MGQPSRALNRLTPDAPALDGAATPPIPHVVTRRISVHRRAQDDRAHDRAADRADSTLHLTDPEQHYLNRALTDLTARERDVLFAICAGGTNEALADRLCIALPTLRTHLMRLNQKLGSTSKGDVVRFVSAHLLDGYRRGRIPAGTTH